MTALTLPGGNGGRATVAAARALSLTHVLILAAATTLCAQPARVGFDYRSDLKLPHEASVGTRGDFNGDGVPDIAVAGQGHITVFTQAANSFSWASAGGGGPERLPVAAATGRLNGDSRDDLVLLCGPKPATAEIYLTGKGNLPEHSSTIELPGDFQGLTIADINGDRHPDLLFYGKKTLGITVFTGNGKGGFSEGPVLFPEVSVSQASVGQMDGDDIADIVLVDWIGNRVEVYRGFGSMTFSDPVVLRFDEEPLALALGDLNGDRDRDIVVGFGEQPGFRVFAGDGSGNYAEFERENLMAAPGKIRVGDFDGDARNDLLLFLPLPGSVVVRYQERSGLFRMHQSYAAGPSAADIFFFQDARKRYLNCAVLSPDAGVVRILHNHTPEDPGPGAWTFATGNDPTDLEICDMNNDGWSDVALTHSSEPVLNLFLNNGRGGLGGQTSLTLAAPATGLISLASGPDARDFLATGADGRTLSYLSVSTADLTLTPMSVHTDLPVEAIDGRRSPGTTGRRVYALREDAGGRDATLLSYDLIDRTRYEESDMRLGLPGRIVATATHDFDGDGMRDLAVLTAPDSGKIPPWTLTVYRQDSAGFSVARSVPVAFPAVQSRAVSLWAADLNGDGATDLIVNAGKPDNILFVALARGDTAFGDATVVGTDVRIPGSKSLSVTDFDSDGRTDLVFVNERTRTVQFLPGDGGGNYSGPVNLTSAKGVRGFGVGDLNREGGKELFVTIADEGILSVTSFHHPLFERRKSRNHE